MAELSNKYKNWSKVLLEPSSMNDARLFALESRIDSEESHRTEEFVFLKEQIQKLVHSI